MVKTTVITILSILLLGLIFLATDIKNAYKMLPMKADPILKVPAFADWNQYVAENGKFKVLFPVVPQYLKQAVPIPNTDKQRLYEMYVSQKMNDTIFMVTLITYPKDIDTSNAKQTLLDLVDELKAAKPDNKMKDVKEGVYQNYPAVDYSLESDEFHVNGKAIMVGKTIFLLNYIARKNNFSSDEYQHFIDSFQLTAN